MPLSPTEVYLGHENVISEARVHIWASPAGHRLTQLSGRPSGTLLSSICTWGQDKTSLTGLSRGLKRVTIVKYLAGPWCVPVPTESLKVLPHHVGRVERLPQPEAGRFRSQPGRPVRITSVASPRTDAEAKTPEGHGWLRSGRPCASEGFPQEALRELEA